MSNYFQFYFQLSLVTLPQPIYYFSYMKYEIFTCPKQLKTIVFTFTFTRDVTFSSGDKMSRYRK